jgi:hypothetical protein
VVIDSLPIHRDSFMKILLVAGARPNFMKIAPIIRTIATYNKSFPLLPFTKIKDQIGQISQIN